MLDTVGKTGTNSFISKVFLWAPMYGHTSVGWLAKTYIHQFCADTGCHLEDLKTAVDKRDGWWDSQENLCYLQDLMMIFIMEFYKFNSNKKKNLDGF